MALFREKMRQEPGPLRLALVGISGFGQFYLQEVEKAVERGQAILVAVCLINPHEEQQACRRLRRAGTRIFARWEEMMEVCRGQVDLCLLPIPIHLHEPMTVRALECGMNVLVEKPLTVGSASFARICEAEKRSGKWVAVGFQDLYRPTTFAIREDLDAGRIGPVRSVTWEGLWPRPEEYFCRNNWAGRASVENRPVLDSPLNNAFAHYLTLSFFWAGAGRTRMANPEDFQAELSRCYSIDTFDTAKIAIQCDTDVAVRAAVTHCCEEELSVSVLVRGDFGWMRWDNHNRVTWSDGAESSIENWQECLETMFAAVFQRTSGRRGRICTPADAYPHVRFIEMLHAETAIRVRADWRERREEGKTFRYLPGIRQELASWIAPALQPPHRFPKAPPPPCPREISLT